MRNKRQAVYVILLAPVVFMASVVIHEIGHAYAISKTGAANPIILVWPGYVIYPDFGEKVDLIWPGKSFAITEAMPISQETTHIGPSLHPPIAPTLDHERIRENESIIVLMGVVATTVTSLYSLACISLFRPRGILLWVLAGFSLMHIDALAYTIFPVFFDAPHFLFWGGTISEPITSLTDLGLSQTVCVTLILVLSIVQFVWLYLLLSADKDVLPHDKSSNYAPLEPEAPNPHRLLRRYVTSSV